MKKKIENAGITLIALVITIVILLILAGVTLNLVLGDNGIIGKAKDAKDKMFTAQMKETLTLNLIDEMIGKAIEGNQNSEIPDIFEMVNVNGLYKIKMSSDRDGTVQVVCDCVIEDGGRLYRGDVGFIMGQNGMEDLVTENMKPISIMDDEAVAFYLIMKGVGGGDSELPEGIEKIDDQIFKYKEQTYILSTTQSDDAVEIYLQQLDYTIVDGTWKYVIMDEYGTSAMAIDENDDLYLFAKDVGNSAQLITTVTPQRVMENVEEVVSYGCDYYIKTMDGKWYIYNNYNNVKEISGLDTMQIKQFVKGKILDEEGTLWEVRYDGTINSINQDVKFNKILCVSDYHALYGDFNGNIWLDGQNITEQGYDIQAKDIANFYKSYNYLSILYQDGELQIFDTNKNNIWENGKVSGISCCSTYKYLIACENNSVYMLDDTSSGREEPIKEICNNLNVKIIDGRYVIDAENYIWVLGKDDVPVRFSGEFSGRKINSITCSKYNGLIGTIIITEDGSMHTIGYFGALQ